MNLAQLSPRDRLLGIAAAAVAALVMLYFGWSWYSAAVTAKEESIAKLQGELRKKERDLLLGNKAVSRLHAYRARSLPADKDVARTLYQQWLLEQAAAAGLEDQNIAAVSTQQLTGVGHQLTFTVKGRATLPQTVKLLDGIERPHYLHRVKSLALSPVANSKLLDVSLTLEALALDKADATDALPLIEESLLKLPSSVEYAAIISGRNLFGPQNRPPRFTSSSSQSATVDREFTASLEAKDSDALDKVSYRLEKNEQGAALDPKTGRFRWTPRKTGKFSFTVYAVDDGLPAAETKTTLTVSVELPRPPDPPKPPEPKKLAFDHAKYTWLIAVLVADDEPEVWLLTRPTGQVHKLKKGASFEIGSLKGEVVDIGPDDFLFEVDGEVRLVTKGTTLDQAEAAPESRL